MDIWLDTTDIKTITLGNKLGILKGVTTNPSLIGKSGKGLEENLDEIPEVKRRINAAIEKTLAHAYLRRIEASILVSERELRDYYEGHLNEFRKP